MRQCLRAVVGMNSGQPLLMRFVGGFGRKAMDEKVLGRATVSESVAEVDFDAADAANSLDPGEFGFSLPKRLKGLVALPRAQALDFMIFCQRNQKACPMIEVLDAGGWRNRPMIAFVVTVLPDPVSPTMAIWPCAGTSSDTPFSTVVVRPYVVKSTQRSRTVRSASLISPPPHGRDRAARRRAG